jgi:hypothetical protein
MSLSSVFQTLNERDRERHVMRSCEANVFHMHCCGHNAMVMVRPGNKEPYDWDWYQTDCMIDFPHAFLILLVIHIHTRFFDRSTQRPWEKATTVNLGNHHRYESTDHDRTPLRW